MNSEIKSSPSRITPLLFCIAAASIICVLGLWPPAAQLFEFRRSSLAAGQLHRLLTCHWTHFSVDHMLWDTAVFALLAFLCWRRTPRALIICLITSSVGIPLMILWKLPAITTYRGLSGLDTAMFGLLAATLLHQSLRDKQWIHLMLVIALLLAFCIKTAIEITTGDTLFVNSRAVDMVPVPLAHLTGLAIGLITGLFSYIRLKPRAAIFIPLLFTGGCMTSVTPDYMAQSQPAATSIMNFTGTYRDVSNGLSQETWGSDQHSLWCILTQDSPGRFDPADKVQTRIEATGPKELTAILLVNGRETDRQKLPLDFKDGYLVSASREHREILGLAVTSDTQRIGVAIATNGTLVTFHENRSTALFGPFYFDTDGRPERLVFIREDRKDPQDPSLPKPIPPINPSPPAEQHEARHVAW